MTIKIAIVGAGISGLTLAHELNSHADVTVFEKARGVGGRMSTRYTDRFEFDHGAQYFTARSDEFKHFLTPLIEEGVVAEWNPRILTIAKGEKPYKRDWFEPHYTANPRMNSLCKALANEIHVEVGVEIASITQEQDRWTLITTNQQHFEGFDWVLCSAPIPQTKKLMPKSFSYTPNLDDAHMTGCMSLMLGINDECPLLFDAAVVKHSPIDWIAVNSAKPNRRKEGCLIIQTTSEWAEAHMEDDLEETKQQLEHEVLALLPISKADILHSAIHRWRYADVSAAMEKDYLLDTQHKLAACGDWCLGGRVENAFLSAYRLAQKIKSELSA